MTVARLTLTELAVVDGGRPASRISFTKGLNLVIGASDTGKTFIFEAIDFMLGARGPLRRIPEARGYMDVLLSLEAYGNPPVTLRRAFSGGELTATEFGSGSHEPPTAIKLLAAVHGPDPDRSLSAYLLRAIGLERPEVRKNARGEKQSLSFRNLSHLALISEERIIQQASPILTGQYTTKTAEESVFAFLLTGADDSSIVAVETKQDRDARLVVQEEILAALLEEERAELADLQLGELQLPGEAARLDFAIEQATQTVVASQADIEACEQRREAAVSQRTQRESRLAFVEEQLGRLRLLQEYYDTDYARLETLFQASRMFHTLPEGSCPFCNRPYDGATVVAGHEEFESACSAEMIKIDKLRKELVLAIGDFDAELVQLRRELGRLRSALAEIERQLEGVLTPSVKTIQGTLETLVRSRSVLAQALTRQSTIDGLQKRLAQVAVARQAKSARRSFERRTTTGATTEFCQVVEELLTAWKYPNLGRVTFDPQKGDLVIGGQDRANKGKGYRAITYAAFVIGLMKYCRSHRLPHPGFVMLDTPLNPFKGPASSIRDEHLADEVKVAFFRNLAAETIEDQIIVMENEDAPSDVRESVTYYRFTKNRRIGRYGFFPQ